MDKQITNETNQFYLINTKSFIHTHSNGETILIRLMIHDGAKPLILGNELAILVNKIVTAGKYSVVFNSELIGKEISSGIYFYQLQTDKFIEQKKCYF